MIDKKLFRKYLDGRCTPEEIKHIHLFFADDRSDLSSINEMLDESWEDSKDELTDAGQSIRIITALRNRLYPAPVVQLSHLKRYWTGYAAAAAMILCIAVAILWQQHFSRPTMEMAAKKWETIDNAGTKSLYAVLPDSSRIWLSPGATLQYAADFSTGEERAVHLNGEAFFDVAHRKGQPFVVYNSGIATKVLGTAFNIEAYAQEATVRISLVRGKVAVKDSIATAALQAGEMLVYDKHNKAMTKEKLRLTDIEQWTKGYTIFNDVPVSAALERIAARYQRKLELGKEVVLSQRRVTTFFKEENMEEMLHLLLFVTQHSYRDDGQTITIIKN